MGLNDHLPATGPDDELAVYALDALEPDEAGVVETRLATDAGAARDAAALADSAGALAVTVAEIDPDLVVAPPADLRHRIVEVAHAARAPVPVAPAAAPDIHRVESERAIELLRGLRAADWRRPVDPPEFAGWTVHDLAVHLATNEALLAQKLGVNDPAIPETDDSNEARTGAARARHADLSPTGALAEYERSAAAVDDALASLGPEDL